VALEVGGINLDEALDGFDNTPPSSGGGSYVLPGEYILRVENITMKKGFRGISFVGTNKVVHVIKSEEGVGSRLDDEANVVENLTKNENAKANIKAYAVAVAESFYQRKVDPKNIKKDFIARCCDASQPLKDVLVRVVAKQVKTRAGGDYTAKTWSMLTVEEAAKYGLTQKVKAPAG